MYPVSNQSLNHLIKYVNAHENFNVLKCIQTAASAIVQPTPLRPNQPSPVNVYKSPQQQQQPGSAANQNFQQLPASAYQQSSATAGG
jgi:hypothetical protein